METENLRADNLLKVALVMEAGTLGSNFKPLAEPKQIEFIYGTAACGITPFEKSIYMKGAGDNVTTVVDLKNAKEYFGPLANNILSWLPERGELSFKVGIQSVCAPQDREVIKALASGGGCGGDCDCGCGCG